MSKIPVAVDLYYSGAWHDITATNDVLTRDPITITRDARPGAGQSMASLSVRNPTGKFSWRLPTSALYGLIGRNTPLRVSIKLASDPFTRTVSNGWGATPAGLAWTTSGGAASDYSTSGTEGLHTHTAAAVMHSSVIAAGRSNQYVDVTTRIPLNSTTGASAGHWVCPRYIDANNYYAAVLFVTPAGNVTLELGKRVATLFTSLSSAVTLGTGHASGDYWRVVVAAAGPVLMAKAWKDGTAEPLAWTLTAYDTSLTSGTKVGLLSRFETGNTDATRIARWDNLSVVDMRFTGEVESWPLRWNVKGNDVWAPIQAFGILRRLGAPGKRALVQSPLRRAALVGVLSTGLVACFPFEEGTSANVGASAVNGVQDAQLTSAVTPGAVTDPQPGILPYATVDSTDAAFPVVSLPASTAGFTSFTAVLKGTMPRPASAKAVIYWPTKLTFTGGSISDITVVAYAKWTGTAFDTSNTGVDVLMTGGTGVGSVVGGFNVNMFDGFAHDIHVRLDQVGADVVSELWIDGVMVDTATSSTKTLGVPAKMAGPVAALGTLGGTAVDNTDTTLGFGGYMVHAGAAPGITATDVHNVVMAQPGETAAERLARLCAEAGIALSIVGTDSVQVGVQRTAPLLELLRDAADADGGILYEPRGFLGLAYRTHASLYNQAAKVTLDYAAGDELAPPLTPVEDTSEVANDITVTRYLGSSSRAVKETGTLNVSEPSDDPQGVGRIPKEHTLVLFVDSQTVQQAFWKRHLGTWDEARYPQVVMDLTAMALAGKTTLAGQASDLDMGDRLVVTNLPSGWLTFDDVEVHAHGFGETLGNNLRSITVDALPALPYTVGVLNTDRLDNGACTTAEALDTTETAIDVVSTGVPWGSQFNYDLNIGGERMTVTARSGAGLTQTLTVTRSVNGVVKSHATGVPVRLWQPLRLAR